MIATSINVCMNSYVLVLDKATCVTTVGCLNGGWIDAHDVTPGSARHPCSMMKDREIQQSLCCLNGGWNDAHNVTPGSEGHTSVKRFTCLCCVA